MARYDHVQPDAILVPRDLVERLRQAAAPFGGNLVNRKHLMLEAADEIEELRDQVKAARHWIEQTGQRST
jgi:hypothetical protein